jgi:hypothetical protein
MPETILMTKDKKTSDSTDDISELYNAIRNIILKHSKGFEKREKPGEMIELIIEKDLKIAGRNYQEMFFVGLVNRRKYVSY